VRILTIVSTYPSHAFGGAEVSAMNSMRWLRDNGHEVGAITTAEDGEPELAGADVDGIRVWRLRWPRTHTHLRHEQAGRLQKLLWHLQDHFDPRNRSLMGRVLDEFRPEIVLSRVLPGIGYNAYYEIGARNIPMICFMHDLNLVCARSDMFRDGQSCEGLCGPCKVVSQIRFKAVSSISRLSFCSPSRANLAIASRYVPLDKFRSVSILNANRYPSPTISRVDSEKIRFLYVGRLHESKGTHLLLQAAASLAERWQFTVTVVGSGPQESELRSKYSGYSWCRFLGQRPQLEVANQMVNSDMLCIPSIWLENSPGVVIQALGLGLPIIGSNKGGIPEYVQHEQNGLLVSPGDLAAWENALERVLENPACLREWRSYAIEHSDQFDQDHIGQQIVTLMRETIGSDSSEHELR
jgi:glycosyltransferase involved in cell wall biosynthesis